MKLLLLLHLPEIQPFYAPRSYSTDFLQHRLTRTTTCYTHFWRREVEQERNRPLHPDKRNNFILCKFSYAIGEIYFVAGAKSSALSQNARGTHGSIEEESCCSEEREAPEGGAKSEGLEHWLSLGWSTCVCFSEVCSTWAFFTQHSTPCHTQTPW